MTPGPYNHTIDKNMFPGQLARRVFIIFATGNTIVFLTKIPEIKE